MRSVTATLPTSRDPADVVAAEIDQHDVLGDLLRIGAELSFQRVILALARPARPGAGNRTYRDFPSLESRHHLGRGTQHDPFAGAQKEHVGRWVQRAQAAIDIEGSRPQSTFKPLCENDLDDIAGTDVLLGALHDPLVLRRFEVRRNLRCSFRYRWQGIALERLGQAIDDRGDTLTGGIVLGTQIGAVVETSVRHDLHRLCDVVEDHQGIGEHQIEVGLVEVVDGVLGQTLDRTHDVVPEESDQTAGKSRQPRNLNRPQLRQLLPHRFERVPTFDQLRRLTRATDLESVSLGDQYLARRGAEKTVTPPRLAALHALEQKRIAAVVELEERRHRCVEIGEDLTVNRNQVPLLRELTKFVEFGLKAHRHATQRSRST